MSCVALSCSPSHPSPQSTTSVQLFNVSMNYFYVDFLIWYSADWFPHALNNYKKNCITYYTKVSLKNIYWYLSTFYYYKTFIDIYQTVHYYIKHLLIFIKLFIISILIKKIIINISAINWLSCSISLMTKPIAYDFNGKTLISDNFWGWRLLICACN